MRRIVCQAAGLLFGLPLILHTTAWAAEARVFEVVLEARPVNPVAYLAPSRASYDLCAASARILHRTAQPYPPMPADLVTETRTYASDGAASVVRVDQLSLDAEQMQPALGCRIEFKQISNVEIRRGTRMQVISTDVDGAVDVGPVTSDLPDPGPARETNVDRYSVRRQINGVALRCLGPDHPVIRSGTSLGACIFDDGHGGTLRHPDGQPLLLYVKTPAFGGGPAARTETEVTPRSVKLGSTLEPKAFAFRPAP